VIGDAALPEIRNDEAVPAESNAKWDIEGRARIVYLNEGIHALTIGAISGPRESAAGFTLPATYISAGPSKDQNPVHIGLTTGAAPGWLSAEGGTVVAKVPPQGGVVVVTTYGITAEATLPQLRVLRVNGLGSIVPQGVAAPVEFSKRSGREIQIEMTVHVARQGDRRLLARGWVGNPGQRSQIEAFGIRPLEAITPADIEYMAIGPDGRQTPWVTDAKLCGTRGRSLALTGFAIRLVPALQERFDVVYEGSFFANGPSSPSRNGERCCSLVTNDPLEAIKLRVIERIGA